MKRSNALEDSNTGATSVGRQHVEESNAGTAEPHWSWLYTIGGAAALFAVAMIPIQLVVFVAWGQPDSAMGWFTLFESNGFAGLLAFELLFVVNAAVGMFGGRYNPSKLGLFHRLLTAQPASPLHGMPAGDARDRAAIRA
jgi:hypothetical protein